MLLVLLVMLALTYNSAFKGMAPTCDRYVLNVYLYTVTYLVMMAWFVMVLVQNNFGTSMNTAGLIGIFVGYIALYFVILFVPKEMVALKHLLSVVYMALSAFVLHMVFAFFSLESVVFVAVMAVILFVILTVIAWRFQQMISQRLSLTVVVVFLLLVVAEFLVGMFYPSSMLEKVIITVVLLFICYFVLVKTKKMIENSKECEKEGGPDYVEESLGFVVSIKNLFFRLLELLGKRRRR